MIGTAWKVRWGPFLLVALWLLGLLLGSIHPAGFLVAIAVLGVAIWFTITLGTYVSLVSHDSRQASSRTLVPVLMVSLSFLTCYMPARFTTVFMGTPSPSFVNWLCLVTYGEIRDVMIGEDRFRRAPGDGNTDLRKSPAGAGRLFDFSGWVCRGGVLFQPRGI